AVAIGTGSSSAQPSSAQPSSAQPSTPGADTHRDMDADEKSGVVSLPAILPSKAGPGVSTRFGALATLGAIALGVCYGAYSVYTAARDAFVVPTIMSPSSEAVVATKLRLGELRVERVRAVGELEGVEADLGGAEQALSRLLELKRTTSEGRHY